MLNKNFYELIREEYFVNDCRKTGTFYAVAVFLV